MATDVDWTRDLAERVRALRMERGLSQKDLATRADLSLRFLADVEGGRGLHRVAELPPDVGHREVTGRQPGVGGDDAGEPVGVLGTLDSKTWREGMSGRVTMQQVRDHMADFKAYMRVEITPRHWARRADQIPRFFGIVVSMNYNDHPPRGTSSSA